MKKTSFYNVTMASPREVRRLFEQRFKSDGRKLAVEFHPRDLDRVMDDRYLMRIIVHVGNGAQQAVDMLWDILSWRAAIGANDINETNIRMDYVNEGSIFPFGRDIDGCRLLVFKSKVFRETKKDFEEVKRLIIYWLDRMEREENGNKISIFCDMSEQGPSDFDINLSKYVIMLFRRYYPHFSNYVVVYQMHWSLSATFKVVKSLLTPEAASRVKFVTKNTISKVVQLDHALKSWGGRNDYVFEFMPERKPNGKEITQIKAGNQYPFPSQEMIRLKANNTIIFRGTNNNLVFCMLLTVTNLHDSALFYEIRTTASDYFSVNPSFNTLDINESKSVVVVVQNNFDSLTMNALTEEKFIAIAIEIPNIGVTREEIHEIWQNAPEFKVQEYMFGHILNEVEDKSTIIGNSLTDMHLNNQTIQNQLNVLKLYQLLTLIVVSAVAFAFCVQHIWS